MSAADDFDVAVIGAGVNGAGIARDAALRGLRVVVLDQADVCSGTSAWSSRLIHGGLRYLEYGEIPLVYESLHERRTLRRIAAHLVKPVRITIPVYEGGRRGAWLVRLGMFAYDLLSVGKEMPGHDMLSRKELLDEAPGLNAEGLSAGARYYDAQVRYAERLVLENLLAAAAAGADVRLWHRVTGIRVDDGKATTVEWLDTIDGRRGSVTAGVIVNAGGPWVDEVLDTAGKTGEQLIGGTKGSHIIVGPFDGAPDDVFYVEARTDGRPFFIIPWNAQYLIGTTDIRYDEPLDEVRASNEEIAYLLSETNRVFPKAALDRSDIHYAYAGVRPLPQRKKGPESAITRKHIIKRNAGIANNLVSIIGGKLTTYRSLAEQAVDEVGKLLRRKLPPCRTADTPLPGGWGLDEAASSLHTDANLNDACAERLLAIYGRRAQSLAAHAENTCGFDALDDDATVLAAEVSFAIREEFARTLTDIVYRRLMVGLDADQGRPLYERIADLAARESGWPTDRRNAELKALLAYSDSLLPPEI
ncbi:MAG: glycerol-3-phosphate dehydrogenase [Woeseiaceae bacterium]|nr:glycerol-3-phosphate dehydrogenase [Woeseiaceae bacterium]